MIEKAKKIFQETQRILMTLTKNEIKFQPQQRMSKNYQEKEPHDTSTKNNLIRS